MFGIVVEELNRLWMQQHRTPGLIANPRFREIWDYILHYANGELLEQPIGSTMRIGNTLITHIPRSLSANLESVKDGYIDWFGGTYVPIDTNWLWFGNRGFMGVVNHLWRGYAEWDVSPIPEGATIMDVAFKYDGERNHAAQNSMIRAMAYQPTARTAQQIYDDAGDGTQYLTSNAVFPEVAMNRVVGTGGGVAWSDLVSLRADLQAALAGGWFALGFQGVTEVYIADGVYANVFYTEPFNGGHPIPPPTLYLEFDLPGPPTLPGSVLTKSQTISSGSRHIEIPYYPYRIELRTRSLLRHITRTLRG